MISGIILAAGASFRMGSPKALLKIKEKTFLRHMADVLYSARVTDIVIVLGSGADEIRGTLGWFTGKVTVNSSWEDGQITSLRSGLDEIASADIHGVIVCPVDRPLISQSLIVALMQGFWTSGKEIVVPVFNGVRGHPVIFARELFEELRAASSEG